jgi:hypothetical protein
MKNMRLLLCLTCLCFNVKNLHAVIYTYNGGGVTTLANWTTGTGKNIANPGSFTVLGDEWDLAITNVGTTSVEIGGWTINGTVINSASANKIALLTTTTGTFTSQGTNAWVVPAANLIVSGINVTYPTTGTTIVGLTYSNLTLSHTSGTSTAAAAITVSGTLTTTSGGILDMGNFTLSVTTTLSNSGKISTTCPTATSATPLSLPAGTWGGTIEYASANAQTVMGGTYTNLTLSGSGTKSTGSTINVGKVYTSESGKLQINSSGSLNITGTLSSNEIHSVGASIELNGGDFIVSGIKNNIFSNGGDNPLHDNQE